MRRLTPHFLAMLLLLPIGPAVAAPPMVDEIKTLSVIADSSLALPVTDIIHQYTTDKYQAVVVSYIPVNEQEAEVVEGVGYDVLITARPKLLEVLKQQGMVDIYTEAAVAKNRLVLAASGETTMDVSLAGQFPLAQLVTRFSWRPGLVVGNPETLLEGSIARQALRHYGVLEDLEPYTIYEKDLTEIVRMIRDEDTIGILYESDAKHHDGIKIVDTIPQNAHQPIVYTAVVLAGDRMEPAREFVNYLTQSQTKKTFESHGFTAP